MSITIALAGNPNCGKTTMFNALTGANQYVGNWPGVTVEKKEGKLKGNKEVTITDLPGIYSLSPYTLEEVVSRNYLLEEKPDVILNIVDASNLERNLYLTTQLLELGIPVVVALNMMDVVCKYGDCINRDHLAKALGCSVVETSALKGEGVMEAAKLAVSKAGKAAPGGIAFSREVENVLTQIQNQLTLVPEEQKRWYAIKLFERDEKVLSTVPLTTEMEEWIKNEENQLDDDSESIMTNERYTYITGVVKQCLNKQCVRRLTASDKIDRVVTNRFLALPIFFLVMTFVYFISVSTVGAFVTDWANDGVFGDGWHLLGIGGSAYEQAVEEYESQLETVDEQTAEALALEEPDPADYGVWVPGVPVLVERGLTAVGSADWLNGLILDGIVGGVGAVLGFVPQLLVLFLFLALLEECGYMARVAFIMDRVFRKFGLSGKSFIPMLISTGCGIPGIMASRTIENDRDRRMTIMTTTFMPCGAKMPIVALIAGALFGGAWWVAPSAYFIGIAAVIVSGIILKKTKMFAGDPAPFVMELPQYHLPQASGVLRSMGERGWSFIKKAGTIILLASIFIWFFSSFGFVDGTFGMVEEMDASMLAAIGSFMAPLFAPLGFGNWQATVATIMGLVAKEEVVGVFGVLYGVSGEALELVETGAFGQLTAIAAAFTTLSAFSFLVFNLLCAPCFAAIGAMRREMNSAKWTWFAIGYQTGFAYVVALMVYQLGKLFTGGGFGIGTVVALILLAGMLYLLFRSRERGRRLTTVKEA